MKRKISFIIILVLLFSSSFTVFANDSAVNTGLIYEEFETLEEQFAELTDEQKEKVLHKLNVNVDETESSTYAVTWKYLSGFTMNKQETSYYCVPASTQAVLAYFTGITLPQAAIAIELGTTSTGTKLSEARIYLNKMQSVNYYVSQSATATSPVMKANWKGAIDDNVPPIIATRFSTSEGWPYVASAHAMCISGARSDKEAFRISDPYIKRVNANASSHYTKSASDIYAAVYNRGTGYIF